MRLRACGDRAIAVLVLGACGPTADSSIDTDVPTSTSSSEISGTEHGVETVTTAVDGSSSITAGDGSTTGSDPPPVPDPPALRWVRQYTADAPGGINALEVTADGDVTLAGGVFNSFKSVLPDADEIDLAGEGSMVLRYEDDALAWSVHDGGRWNYLLEPLDDGAVITVGSYYDLHPVFAAGLPQEVVLPATFGEGMYVARYTGSGTLEWVLAASNGNPGAVHASIDPFGELSLLGFTNGGTSFQPDGQTVAAGYFRGQVPLDGQSIALQAGAIAIDAPPGRWAYNLWVDGPEFWPDGSSVFAGHFCGSLVVAPGEANATEIVSDPPECGPVDGPFTNDGLLTRYAADGSLDWLLTPLTPGGAALFDARVTPQGRIVVVGYTTDSLELVDTHGGVEAIEGPASFFAAFELDGELVWVRRIETMSGPPTIDGTPEGGIVAVGTMQDSVVVEPGSKGEETLTGPGIYAIHYDGAGELQRAAMLVAGETYMSYLLVSVGDEVFGVVGTFQHAAVLLPGGPDERVLEAEFADLFVALFELE